jgi:hypothetical protein
VGTLDSTKISNCNVELLPNHSVPIRLWIAAVTGLSLGIHLEEFVDGDRVGVGVVVGDGDGVGVGVVVGDGDGVGVGVA